MVFSGCAYKSFPLISFWWDCTLKVMRSFDSFSADRWLLSLSLLPSGAELCQLYICVMVNADLFFLFLSSRPLPFGGR